MDEIAVTEEGQVMERGSHDELLAVGARYREMREAADATVMQQTIRHQRSPGRR
jgi:hypothetical protein